MKRGRSIPGFTFWLVWAVALVPLIFSSVAYLSGWRPGEQINQGILYPAGVRLEQLDVPLPATGRWQLILLADKPCRNLCAEWQSLLPNLHTSLGRDRDRLQWLQYEKATGEEGLLLVDPQGFMVSRYGLDLQPQRVIKDLKRLLRISKVG